MRGARAAHHAVGRGVLALSRRTVLALRALGLGDFLTGLPAVRAVGRGLPDHEVLLACPEELQPLVGLAGAADRVLPTRGLDPIRWSGAPPTVAVNLHGRGPESHRLLQALRPGTLVAFACDEVGVEGPTWRADEHEVSRWCRLADHAGWPADPGDLGLRRPDVPPDVDGAVVVHPGAAHAARRWPASRFAEVAARVASTGLPVVVTGAAGERELATRVAAEAGLASGHVLAGETDLLGLAAVVAAARLVICGDTGVAHLATAFGTPSVVLFGPVAPSLWGPPADGPHTVLWHGDGTGSPWAEAPDPALLRITVEEVDEAVRERLGATRRGSSVTEGLPGAR